MNRDNQPIDWDEVKRRLEQSTRALERSLGEDEHRVEAVYRQRAAQLAARKPAAAAAATAPVLIFALGEERYAVPLRDLMAVLPFAGCTPLPGAPPELLGVTNVRGEIRSVLDLRRLLGLPEGQAVGPGYILLVCHGGRVVGLRVDALEKAGHVAPEALVPLSDARASPRGGFVKGLTPDRVIVLDTGAVLDHPVFHPANP